MQHLLIQPFRLHKIAKLHCRIAQVQTGKRARDYVHAHVQMCVQANATMPCKKSYPEHYLTLLTQAKLSRALAGPVNSSEGAVVSGLCQRQLGSCIFGCAADTALGTRAESATSTACAVWNTEANTSVLLFFNTCGDLGIHVRGIRCSLWCFIGNVSLCNVALFAYRSRHHL